MQVRPLANINQEFDAMDRKWRLGLIVTLVFLGAVRANAQDDLLDDLYGRGVHAYNAQDYRNAWTMFNDAIAQGSLDPRAFYFRGLALTRLGRSEDASADFQRGAQLEVTSNAVFPVGRSLSRIQGTQRLALEAYRQKARLALRAQRKVRERARYEQLRRNEEGVLRAGVTPSADSLPQPGDTESNPFKDDNGLAEGTAVAAPERTSGGTALDTSSPQPAAGDDGTDIFGGGDDKAMDDDKGKGSDDAGSDLFGNDDAPNPFE